VLSVAIIQIVLSILSLVLVYRIALSTYKTAQIGCLAAWLFAIEPLSIQYSVRLISESLFLFILLLSIQLLFLYFEGQDTRLLFFVGLLLAIATYVRPVAYYLGLFVALGIALTAGFKQLRFLKCTSLFLLAFLPLIMVWRVRNQQAAGYQQFSGVVDKNLYFFEAADVTAKLRHVSLADQQKALGRNSPYYLQLHPDQSSWSQAQRLQFMHSEAIRIIREHPALFLKSYLRGLVVVIFSPGSAEFLQLIDLAYPSDWSLPQRIAKEGIQSDGVKLLTSHLEMPITISSFEVFLLSIYLSSLVGVFYASGNRLLITTLVCFALYFILVSGGGQAVGRYRLPAMPEFCVLAASGLQTLRQKFKRKNASASGN